MFQNLALQIEQSNILCITGRKGAQLVMLVRTTKYLELLWPTRAFPGSHYGRYMLHFKFKKEKRKKGKKRKRKIADNPRGLRLKHILIFFICPTFFLPFNLASWEAEGIRS